MILIVFGGTLARIIARAHRSKWLPFALVSMLLVALISSLGVSLPAVAAPPPTAVLDIHKSVDHSSVGLGGAFVYTIAVDCSTDNCPNATATDVIPPQFDALTLDPVVSITGGPATYSWGGSNSRTLTVNFTKAVPGGVGIPAGGGYSIVIRMSVPSNLTADWPSNGVAVTNTASVIADTAAAKTSSADVTVVIPVTVNTAITKTWAPSSTQYLVGEQSTISLSTQNTSNTKADSLTLTEPADPTAAGNPFNTVTFSGFAPFTASSFPAGADQVTVDAYVAGSWILGTPASTPDVPAGVDPATVTGIRATFSSSTGTTLTPGGSAGSIGIHAIQRATVRGTGTSLISGASVTNIASSTVSVPGQTPVTNTASATYTIAGLNTIVSGAKSFSTNRIPGGTSTRASVTATNSSNGPLKTLTITDPSSGSFFSDTIAFDHFDSSVDSWPSGATSATVNWQVNTGTTPDPSTFTSSDPLPGTPALASGQWITGFTVTYTGLISVNASAVVPFWVAVADDAVPLVPGIQTFTNHAQIDGSNDAGDATPVTVSADLTVLFPALQINFTKSITPTGPVAPGGRSTVQLFATTSSDSGYVVPHSITITDQWGGTALDYWNAFNLMSIAPTQVSQGSTLDVSYTTDGTTWVPFATVDATVSAQMYSATLPSSSSIQGVKFVFNNDAGYAQGSAVAAAMSFQARATLRDGSGPTATPGNNVTYTNDAVTDVVGTVTQDGAPVSVSKEDTASADAIVKASPSGAGGLLVGKQWQQVAGTTDVNSQSGQSRDARLTWGTELDGYGKAEVSDPAVDGSGNPLPVAQTVFQNFDLVSIGHITTGSDPLIEFDEVTKVELYNGTTWVAVSSCTTVSPCQGGFPGYTLTAGQVTSTVGFRITFAEYANGRKNNPLAPPIGSGVASNLNGRSLDLIFQVRNQLRDSSASPTNPWITGSRVYNDTDPGLVDNTTRVVLYPINGDPSVQGAADDSILIVDGLPQLSLTKASSKSSVSIPIPADVAAASYPTNSFTMVATNTSAARAWYIRVTDQMPCAVLSVTDCVHNSVGLAKGYTVNPYTGATYDASTNPFEQFTLTKITLTSSSSSGISLPLSTVTLWYADGTTQNFAGNSATLATASSLVNVVGVSVLFASTSTTNGGTIASNATGTVKLDTILRANLRSTPATPVSPKLITNSAFAQIYDDVLNDTDRYQSKSATINLLASTLFVTAAKSFSPSSTLLEANRGNTITVNLAATSGTAAQSTASAKKVVIDDSTPAFWNNFTLQSIGTVVLPVGANRVQVDAQVDSSGVWTLGSAAATAALPGGVTASHVTGIRFTFTNSAGTNFSAAAPAPPWTSSAALLVQLRNTYAVGGAPITFPGSVTNTVNTYSYNDAFTTVTASATATMTLDAGTFKVDVVKTPASSTSPAGEFVDWTLVFTNTGTGYLNNPVVTDSLPIDGSLSAGGPLLFDPTTVPTYAHSSGGVLPVTGVAVAYNDATRKVKFTWPSGSRLAPGEKYTITISLQLAPGLPAAYGAATNNFTVTSDRVLSACTNVSGNLQGVTFSADHTSCTTKNSITTFAASAISSFKGVKGNVDGAGNSTMGALNMTDASIPCVSDSQGFYRNPCAAGTVVGGTDLWKLQFTNGGNIPATSATIVDMLPRPSDTFLRTSASRGSTYLPTFAGAVNLLSGAPAGTTFTWQVTTNANACPSYETNPTCSTATWVSSSIYDPASYGLVRGIRVIFDFSGVAGGALAPAATLAITYKSINVPATSAGDTRVHADQTVVSAQAWNTFGVYATFGSGFSDRKVEPVRAGVHFATGPLLVTKVIAGTSASYAPVSYTVTVTCTVAGVTVALPNAGILTLAASSTIPYTGRIDGIPVGSDCRVVETGASGADSVAYSPLAGSGPAAAEVTIGTAAGSTDPVPASQQTTVTNTYGVTSLTVSKSVTTDSTVGAFGPFAFSVTCSVNNGASVLSVPLDGGVTTETFSLLNGQSKEIDNLPVTAVCSVSETDSDHASSIALSVDGAPSSSVIQSQAVNVPLSPGSGHSAAFTNHYQGGQLAVSKILAGGGQASYGSGPFAVSVICDYYGGQTLLDTSISILGGETKTLDPIFPVGTVCAVNETDAGGATTSSSLATISIPGPTGTQTVGLATVGITNTFSIGSITVVKSFAGAGKDVYGIGPFTAHVSCQWVKDSTTYDIALPFGGDVSLNSGNGYTQTISGLIAGATCTVTEPETGGATSNVIGVMSPSTIAAGGTSTVTITNTFDTGSLIINKVRSGDSDAVSRFGAGPFRAHVDCSFDKNGDSTEIDLGTSADQTLSSPSYSARIDGILVGASCTVSETDRGLAVSSELNPSSGTVTIVDSSVATQATVTITNDFVVGTLHLDKTPSISTVQGDTNYDYTFVVKNTGTVNATGVTLVDPLNATLKATTPVAPAGWTCSVDGADLDGYGGQLNCLLNTDLAAGATAPAITLNVTVLSTIHQDTIDNTATVTSTNPIVDGDTASATVNVKWLDISANSQCIKDAPWLNYTIDAHNVTSLAGRVMHISWADKDGNFVHQDDVTLTADGTITGSILWPGAAVRADGAGIAWPGWRNALPGETPDWENLVLDPAAYGYTLRDHPLITISINPTSTFTVAYPDATPSCEVLRTASLDFTKTANLGQGSVNKPFTYTMSLNNTGLGAVNTVTLVDPVPSSLKVLGTQWETVPTGSPDWSSCTVTNRQSNGFGGTLTCLLDRPLGYNQSAPDVYLRVIADKRASGAFILNTGHVTAQDSSPLDLPTLALESSAIVPTSLLLAFTGAAIGLSPWVALAALLFGLVLVLWARSATRRKPESDGEISEI